jgi:hypothetical protein
MSPEARALLDGVRHAEDPTRDDEQRVLAAVRATVVASAVVGASLAASRFGKLTACLGTSGAKLSVTALCLATAAGAFVTSSALREPSPAQSAPVARRSPAATLPPSRSTAGGSLRPLAEIIIANPEPSTASAAAPAPARHRAQTPRSTARRPRAASLRSELALLADVQNALRRGDGARALRKLDRHRTSDQQLLAERRALRILALCLTGATAEARLAAAEFAAQHPSSVQRAAIESSCATSKMDLPGLVHE